MVVVSFLSTIFLALAVTAHPVERGESLPHLRFTKHIIDGVFNIIDQDLLRAKYFKEFDIFGFYGSDSPAVNKAVSYIASVGVGFPPTYYELVIDTGSSNIWIGSGKPYVKTSTSHKTHNSVSVVYGSGNFNGTEYIDQVTISPELVIPKQSIGVANETKGFDTVNGIIGIGPTNLTNATLHPDTTATIPTVTDSLFAQHSILEALVSVSFEPITVDNSTTGQINGELTWGGIDYTKIIGDITYTAITTVFRSSIFWGIDACLSYGNTPLLPATAGIVDTGTTLLLLATDAFNKYKEATGGILDDATTLLKITPAQYAKLECIFVTVQDVPFELIPNAQIWPRQLNTDIGGTAGSIYLIVGDLGTPSGVGMDFFLGQAYLERFYSVFDTTNSRVGLAKTRYTYATTN